LRQRSSSKRDARATIRLMSCEVERPVIVVNPISPARIVAQKLDSKANYGIRAVRKKESLDR
jgi:ribosomal protein L18